MNEKKLNSSVLLHYADVMEAKDTTVLWHGKQLVVKKYIPLQEILQIVDSVVSGCVINNGESISPILAEIIFKAEIVSHYSSIELPDDPNDLHRVIYLTDIFEFIKNNTNRPQIEDIKHSIDEIISHL